MEIESKKETNKFETWEYWENKFKGMSEDEIEKYWDNQREEASSDDSILMDFADGVAGLRLGDVNYEYEQYIKAKEKHEIENSKTAENNTEDNEIKARQNHSIEEVKEAVSDRKSQDINKVVSEISEEMKDKTKENEKTVDE